jgi:Gar1/Naf1 RNA binding region
VDEILGPINQVYFTIKPQDGIQATSFKSGDRFYIGGDKLLPLEKLVLRCLVRGVSLLINARFLPKPKPPPGTTYNHGPRHSLLTTLQQQERRESRNGEEVTVVELEVDREAEQPFADEDLDGVRQEVEADLEIEGEGEAVEDLFPVAGEDRGGALAQEEVASEGEGETYAFYRFVHTKSQQCEGRQCSEPGCAMNLFSQVAVLLFI